MGLPGNSARVPVLGKHATDLKALLAYIYGGPPAPSDCTDDEQLYLKKKKKKKESLRTNQFTLPNTAACPPSITTPPSPSSRNPTPSCHHFILPIRVYSLSIHPLTPTPMRPQKNGKCEKLHWEWELPLMLKQRTPDKVQSRSSMMTNEIFRPGVSSYTIRDELLFSSIIERNLLRQK